MGPGVPISRNQVAPVPDVIVVETILGIHYGVLQGNPNSNPTHQLYQFYAPSLHFHGFDFAVVGQTGLQQYEPLPARLHSSLLAHFVAISDDKLVPFELVAELEVKIPHCLCFNAVHF